MADLAREWGQRGTDWSWHPPFLHLCFKSPISLNCLSFPQDGKRDITPPSSCLGPSFFKFTLHYLHFLRLPLSSWPNLTKQHSTSRGDCMTKGAKHWESPSCDSVGNQHGGRSGSGKSSEFGVRKPASESLTYWLCYPGKSPVLTPLSLVPVFINWR